MTPKHRTADLRARCRGVLPLDARLEEWAVDLLSDPTQVADLVSRHGSPVNVLDFTPLARNASELLQVGHAHGVQTRLFVARKANKAIGLVRAAREAHLGVDVASLGELTQCLDLGVTGEDLVVTAAVKGMALLDTCVAHDVPVSVDNLDEFDDLVDAARRGRRVARVALRLSVEDVAPTRFGLSGERWLEALAERDRSTQQWARIEGVHFHLNGYDPAERATGLREAVGLVDTLRAAGHPVRWIDIGGGVPMSYLVDERQWRTFWRRVAQAEGDEITWRGDRLGLLDPSAPRPSPTLYPYWQREVRGQWLHRVLEAPAVPGDVGGDTIADLLRDRTLELRLEPGRALLDGCGMTLAAVAARKETNDGTPLVVLHMNRTQVRSTSADFLVDPLLVRPPDARPAAQPGDGFLVGAYCVEEELILRRRLTFPDGVSRDDVLAFPNTGGYLMHILESASHQLPLAATLVHTAGGWERDPIDAVSTARSGVAEAAL
ncbi:alanine racemase [Nocardioides yefusunii]|uniref:Alanine racemase n=1 Tax=Nocardioides yefusunii TaxID=2500546 RepID=A0ABW1QV35_9ACTN|nr:alanine racemase [Nocardioides yefusunii]